MKRKGYGQPSAGIKHYFYDTLSKTIEPNIFNLDSYFRTIPKTNIENPNKLDTEYYLKCKLFIDEIIKKIADELDSEILNETLYNPEKILQVHAIDGIPEEDLRELEGIKNLYYDFYVRDLVYEVQTNTGRQFKKYPLFLKDLYDKNAEPYKKFEEKMGLKSIYQQTDEEFLETLQKRIDGLRTCQTNSEGQKEGSSKYFKREEEMEQKRLDELKKTQLEPKSKIDKQCKTIYYSSENFEKHEKIDTPEYQMELKTYLYELFNPLTEEGRKEILFAKTFLPDTYFIYGGNSDLDILPINSSMVYKILTPIDEPLILNLIYVAYCNFKDLIFYKPIQNSQSREFYIIGKGYLGTNYNILEIFYNALEHFTPSNEYDLFKDIYPIAFVKQIVDISTRLSENYCYTIERNIYYLDNYENITPQFAKMLKDYYNEKNHDWIDKYKPIRIENDTFKL
jgi:hypothetical protein